MSTPPARPIESLRTRPAPPSDPDVQISFVELAQILDISLPTVHRWCHTGLRGGRVKLSARLCGQRWMTSWGEYLAFCEEVERTPVPEATGRRRRRNGDRFDKVPRSGAKRKSTETARRAG